MYDVIRMALDKSVRTIDQDGHLHVSVANISRAMVNPYRGNEIPNYEELGLDPARVYQLLRDPEELQKAASTFAGKPLLSTHRPQTAADHAKQVTVGSIGSTVQFDAPFLRAPLVVWDGEAIDGIESGEQRELSCGYRYDADMTPGTYQGARYDGVMRNIRGNHVSLVSSGRAGSDVVVGDAAFNLQEIIVMAVAKPAVATTALSRKALLASGAILSYVRPKLAQDAKIDLAPMLRGVTAKNWKTSKPKIVAALDAALKGKLAQDATIADFAQMLDQLDNIVDAGAPDMPDAVVPPLQTDPAATDTDEDADQRLREFLTGKLSDEDLETAMTMLKPEVDATDPADPAAPPAVDANPADPMVPPLKKKDMTMDAAMVAAIERRAAKQAETSTIARMNAIREAEAFARPWTGIVTPMACDSADGVYKSALDLLGIEIREGVHPSAYRDILAAQPKPGDATPRPRAQTAMAQDAANAKSYADRFPNANRLQQY